jgi:hypothetical protein
MKKIRTTFLMIATAMLFLTGCPPDVTEPIMETVETPTFTPTDREFTNPIDVGMYCETDGAKIYYTKGSGDPDILYSAKVPVSETTTFRVHASKDGMETSEIMEVTFTKDESETVANPIVNKESGSYENYVDVTFDCSTDGATLRYTLDGTIPTSTSGTITYNDRTVRIDEDAELNVIAYKNGMNPSEVSTYDYTIIVPGQVATPVISPSSMNFTASVNIEISCATDGATIRYTKNGTVPSKTNGFDYNEQIPEQIPVTETTTIRAMAWKDGMTDSGYDDETFTKKAVDTTPPSIDYFYIEYQSTYTDSASVTLSMRVLELNVNVRFSNDGENWSEWESIPNTKVWTLSSGDGTKIVYAEFKDTAGNVSEANNDIVLDTNPPEINYFRINSGPYTKSRSVTLYSSVSNAAQMRFHNYGESWSDWETYDSSKSWTLSSEDGTKTVYVQYRSNFETKESDSDSIILDTKKPIINYFYIDNNDEWTNSRTITVSWSASGEYETRFKTADGWSDWRTNYWPESFEVNLPSGDGTKRIDIECMDEAGNVSSEIDLIKLDTQKPIVESFYINSDTYSTYKTDVYLNISASGSPVKMRLSNGGNWLSWENYSSYKNWQVTASENYNRYVYVQVKDAAGNISDQDSDGIYYDAKRTLRFVPEEFEVDYDGNSGYRKGLLQIDFHCVDKYADFRIYTLPSWTTMTSGEDYPISSGGTRRTFDNIPGETYDLTFYIVAWHGDGTGDISNEVSVTYSRDSGWGIGTGKSIYASQSGDSPSGWMKFRIEYVD